MQAIESPLPLAAQGQRVVEGILEVVYEDSIAGARLTHHLNTGTERIALRFARDPPERLRTGSRVRARGVLREKTLQLETDADVSRVSADDSSVGAVVPGLGSDGSDMSGFESQELASPNTFGAQSTLVILFNFQDNTAQPYGSASAQSVTFGEVNAFYQENSFGQTWLEGGLAVGWYTIPSTSTSCNYNLWASQADTAATNAGYNVASYPRRVYGFPLTSACTWWGLGTVGGGTISNPSRAWINGPYSLRVVGHEIGHNLGLFHSRSRTCDAGGCVIDEYGDDHDIMGAVTGHFNAFQKRRLGWLDYGSSPAMQTVTETGQYPLEPYATPNGGLPKALRVFKSTTGSSSAYIYAEARTQYGADASLTPGVVIHTGVDNDGSQGYLYDLQPSSSATDFILDPGQSVTFSEAGPPVTLTALSFGASGAVLAVTVPCAYTFGAPGQSFASAGGSGGVALATGNDCEWDATSDSAWLTLHAGSTAGVGPSTLEFTVAPNPSASARAGTLTIAGQTFAVTEDGLSCSYSVSTTIQAFNYTGGAGTDGVTADAGCDWTASSNATWITITGGTPGTGHGNVTYSVASHTARTARTGTLTIAGQTVTVNQEGVAALFIAPTNGATKVNTSLLFRWTAVSTALRYVLTIGTTPGGADVLNTGEITTSIYNVLNLPPSSLLYARVRTKFDATTWTASDVFFTTIDRPSGVLVLGSQTPGSVVAGGSAQYGESSGASVKVTFTGSGGGCTAVLSATGLPAGASAIFAPTFVTSSVIDRFALLTIVTTTATAPGNYTFTVRAQGNGACNSGAATNTAPLTVVGGSALATTLSPAAASGTYGSSSTVSATLSASGSPVSGKTIAFTLNGNPAGTAVTDAGGFAALPSASLAGISAASYPAGVGASFAGDGSYEASSGNGSLMVSPKSLTPAVVVANRPYNGTTSATLTSCTPSGVVGGDVVSCTGTAAFATASVGAGKSVTVTGLTLTGAAAANYTLAMTTATTTAAITAVPVTPTVAAANKVYSGTTSATLTSCTIGGAVGGDAVSCTGSAAFDSASVGAGKTVTVSGLTLTGAAAGNYTLSTATATTTAAITAVTVTPAVAAADRVYDGTTNATLTSCTLGGLVGADVVTCTGSAAFDTASVGVGKTVTVSGLTLAGAAAGNYTLATTTATTTAAIGTATVTPAVAAYSFSEGAGTTVLDTSGYGNTGSLTNVTWTAAGKYGGALSFNGSSARVTIPHASSLHLTTAMTLEAWVKPSTVTNAWRDVIYKGNDNYFLEATSPTSSRPAAGGTFGSTAAATYGMAILSPNTWTHLAATYDGATLRLYVNGIQVSAAAQTGSLATSINPLEIGGDSIYGRYFKGTIDEVRVYNVALTATQIQSDMNTPIGSVGATPDLTVTKTHAGGFTQGQTGAKYTVTVYNAGTWSTTGAVAVWDTLPNGLTATGLSGTGWSCTLGTLVCTRTNALAAGASYPPVTVTVTVASTAPANVTNQVTVSGGGDIYTANNSASDPTAITPTFADLTVTKTHAGGFTQGQTVAKYTVTVRNAGTRLTSGAVTVVDTLPNGLTATGLSGTGWSCTLGTLTCTRSNALAVGASYPPVTVTVTVASSAPANVTNQVTVGGGGEIDTANNGASDPTTITSTTSGLLAAYSVNE